MPAVHSVLGFALASLIIIAIPGPSVLFVIGRSLALGRRAGLLSVLGNELGCLPIVTAVALGVGSVLAESVVVFTVVKLLGMAYLVHLGIQAIRHRRDGVGPAAGVVPASSWTILRQGFVVGVTNPKTVVFFVAVLPQFVDFSAGAVPVQMAVLGVLFTLIALVCDSCWAVAAGAARDWFATSPRRLAKMRAAGGGMMIALGGSLLAVGQGG